ncbi:MAG: 4-(cytidine 5'-diphospho)-2-C-methyl-D-erythritol kinase, partial [Chloroflexota bacterium]
WRALTLLRERAGACSCAHIQLLKAIPTGSGLGGGSADAAATLLALDRLWQLGLSQAELASLAAELGSDVPYFLVGGTALVRGRGEQVEPLPDLPARWLVLLCPEPRLPRKTAELYARLRPELYDDGAATKIAAQQIGEQHFPAETLLRNTFEKVADGAFPGLAAARARLTGIARRPVHLSGAGPTLFAAFEDRREAEWALSRIWREGERAYLVQAGAWRCSPRLDGKT